MILGLDISTSITGVTVLDDEGSVQFNEAWDTRNKNHFPNLFRKAEYINLRLLNLQENFSIDSVYIEQSLQSFRSGFSSAQTLSILSRFNGIVSWLCYDIFGQIPEMIPASTARKMCGIKIKRGENTKAKVLQFIVDTEPSFGVLYTKHGNPKPGCFDRADSLVIARAGYELCKQRN